MRIAHKFSCIISIRSRTTYIAIAFIWNRFILIILCVSDFAGNKFGKETPPPPHARMQSLSSSRIVQLFGFKIVPEERPRQFEKEKDGELVFMLLFYMKSAGRAEGERMHTSMFSDSVSLRKVFHRQTTWCNIMANNHLRRKMPNTFSILRNVFSMRGACTLCTSALVQRVQGSTNE